MDWADESKSWRDRFTAIVGEDRPDMAGNRVLKLKDEIAMLRDALRSTPCHCQGRDGKVFECRRCAALRGKA